MSEARNQRFEIDIDEIERQLRRSVEQPHEPRPDPLAELARIVGQNDPFQGILSGAQPARNEPANANHPAAHAAPPPLPGFGHADERHGPYGAEPHATHGAADHQAVAHDPNGHYPAEHHPAEHYPAEQGGAFDPVAEAYGSQDGALAQEEFQPLRRRPSRGKLVAVMAALVVTVSAVAAGMSWRKSGGFLSSGTPKVIVADTSPLKVAPENPGGVEVPNQDRQIYARAPQDGQSRVVDGREQPVDVRAATPAVSARAPVSSERSPVSEALGDPRRVRTVAVNPDGTSYTPSTPAAASAQNVIPSGGLPPPVSVQTVSVPTRTAAVAPAPAPVAERAPVAAAPAPAVPAAPPMAAAEEPTQSRAPVSVLPPARPHIAAKPAVEAPSRTASVAPAAPAPKAAAAPKPAAPAPKAAAKPKPAAEAPKAVVARTENPAPEKPAAGSRSYTVQIAVRPTEQEARSAWDQAQEKFGSSLENRPARLTSAKVNGKTVHRVRLGPMTKPEADAMCGRLKAKGSNCFVAVN